MGATGGLTALKEILFEEESKKYLELSDKLKEINHKIEESLNDKSLPESEVNEIIKKVVQVMPEKMGPAITATLKIQIKESRDEVVQALFPIIGQMIKKYVAQEIEVLTERIDRQLEESLSLDGIKLRLKALFTGVKYSDLMLQKSNEPHIQQIFIIEENSGILMASFTRGKALDQDMIAGMLTAIKSFVEDAFEGKGRNLESINYDDFNIYLQNFNKFYFAVAMTGTVNAEFKQRLDTTILKFVKEIMMKSEDSNEQNLENRLSQYFGKI